MTPAQHRYWWVIGGLIGATVLIELVLTGADLQLWGSPGWRSWAYAYMSFQPWLLTGHDPIWAGQWLGMFLTHIVLHIGLLHMASNMLALALLAVLLRDEITLGAMLTVCLISAVGGAALFALLAPPFAAMTGASGALSGLTVVWAVGNAPGKARSSTHQKLTVLGAIVALILLIEVFPGSQTAWQAHLGGALAGMMAAAPRPIFRV